MHRNLGNTKRLSAWLNRSRKPNSIVKKVFAFDCGLIFSPLFINESCPSSVIAGFYNGITLERYLEIDKASKIHLFEASEMQRERISKAYYRNCRINICMTALCGTVDMQPKIFKDYERKTTLHKGNYGYGALEECLDNQKTNTSYKVSTMNLKYYLDILPSKEQTHIHLDIEGAEIEVIESFGGNLDQYTNQLSLELEPGKTASLRERYIQLHRASGLKFACLLVHRDGSFIDIDHYKEIICSDKTRGVNIYMIKPGLIRYLDLDSNLQSKYQAMLNNIISG